MNTNDQPSAADRGSGLTDRLGLVARLRAPSMTDTTATHIDRMRMAADEIERLRDLLRDIYDRACRDEIGVLDRHGTCGGGAYTLWDTIKRASNGDA